MGKGDWANDSPVAKKIIIIAGPKGAGETTFANEFLPKEANCRTFVNADLIAVGLAPFEPEQVAFKAGRLMLEDISIMPRLKYQASKRP